MRLLLSVLSGKPVRINDIRRWDDFPGLREYEVNLIRLLDKITNGTVVELNYTGTSVYFQPGLLHGGQITHECCKLKGISYYLEVLIALGPFCKRPLKCVLTGVTNTHNEISVDSMVTGVLPVLKQFLVVDDGLSLKVVKRGMAPEGGGLVEFSCPARKSLKPIQVLKMGKVKRIRGVVYAVRVSPTFANRIVETAKGVLLNFLPDVFINTDHCKGDRAGKSPGFGVSLTAETTTGVFFTCDAHSVIPGNGVEPSVPEDIGTHAANLLLEEIYRGGCVTSSFQSLAALWMVLTQRDVSKFLTGPLSPYTIKFLQHIQDFFGVTFKLDTQEKEDSDSDLNDGATKVMLTCLGIGYSNLSKRTL
ncbi:hypothetical protein RUM43_013982 [Polyplax serrata]|uniref:RNA 3'-terminal phosphate cyclase-like protein n=1 Tax=Polyplax serrata TaxID=468196 RepID=A0AAN8NIV8_POLSC